MYLTPGALWGAQDIKRMSDAGKLARLSVVMKKHPDSLYPRKGTPEHAANEAAKLTAEACVLYEGPVRKVCFTNIQYFSLHSVYIQCEGFAKLTFYLGPPCGSWRASSR